jgi:RNA polymerase sigma factor (sigma-70 family)
MSSIAELGSPRQLAVDGGRDRGLLIDLDDVARLYGEEAVSVRRIVRMNVTASPAVIEDACQVAWTRLLIHRARLRRESARAWLIRVAIREVIKSIQRERRERSLEALLEQGGRSAPGGSADAGMALPTPALIEDLAEQKSRLDSIQALPERQRRLLWLQGLGLSYREMAGETGMTRRTVERQLIRARSSLAKEAASPGQVPESGPRATCAVARGRACAGAVPAS